MNANDTYSDSETVPSPKSAHKGLRTTVRPIKEKSDIKALHEYLLSKATAAKTTHARLLAYRNWLFFALGINMARRGGDLSELTWGNIVTYDPSDDTYTIRDEEFNCIREQKTDKEAMLVFNEEACRYIRCYLQATGIKPYPDLVVFPSSKSGGSSKKANKVAGHIDCDNFGRILKSAAKACGIKYNVCTHTLRKTFGYCHYKANHDIVMLQKIFGHVSPDITLRYIGIDDETIRAAFEAKPDTGIDNLEEYFTPCGQAVQAKEVTGRRETIEPLKVIPAYSNAHPSKEAGRHLISHQKPVYSIPAPDLLLQQSNIVLFPLESVG